jgi:hypothetical protein
LSPRSTYTEKSDILLRAALDADEEVVARGLASEYRSGGNEYLLVTARRLLWVPVGLPRWGAELDLDDVAAWAEGTQYHRWGLLLKHRPIERLAHAPEHRVLWWAWGDTEELRRQEETRFMFSRRDTDAAVAIRDQLERRDVKILEPLNFEELPREERAGGGIFTAGRRARLSRAWTERYFGLRSWP